MIPPKEFSKAANIMGVPINDCPKNELIAFISHSISTARHAIIANVNIYALNLAYNQPRFRAFLNNADIVFCDGFGVWLGGRILGFRINHRNTPPDWIDELCSSLVGCGFTIYLLGARPGIAKQAAETLLERHPGLIIAGAHDGYFDKTRGSDENQGVIDEINHTKTNVLLVGFGMPIQEYWIEENWPVINAQVVIPVGALFDYISSTVPRAPRWMTDHGLEWLGRLIIEPRRLWKRYIIGNPVFLWRVLLQKFGLLKLKS